MTYSPAPIPVDAKVIGWIKGLLQPPWNCVRDVAPAVVLVPVDHTLDPDLLNTDANDVLLPKEYKTIDLLIVPAP